MLRFPVATDFPSMLRFKTCGPKRQPLTPMELEQLGVRGPGCLTDSWGSPWHVACDGRGVHICSPGPDRTIETTDDICVATGK